MSSRLPVLIRLFSFVILAAIFSESQTITGITPTSGVAGTQVTITGQYLHPVGGNIQGCIVSVGNQSVDPITWSNTQIVLIVPPTLPGNTTAVPVVIDCWDTWDDYFSNVVNWTVLQPIISSVTPIVGLPYSDITISGSGFGAVQGSSTVSFKGATASVKSWNDALIVATVPLAAQTGPVVVSVPGLSPSHSPVFYVLPHIDLLSPSFGTVGTQITVSGQSLTQSCPQRGLFFGSVNAPILSWTDTQIIATVPTGLPTNANPIPVVVSMWDDYECSSRTNSLNFALTTATPPAITVVSPPSGAIGASVTITGTGFGSAEGTSTVSFNGTNATPSNWSDSQIVVSVPQGATTGPVSVTISSITAQGPTFTVLTGPSVTGISPTSGPVGTEITILGSGFGDVLPVGSTVMLGSIELVPTFWSDTSIRVVVPGTSGGGMVSVSLGGNLMNAGQFTVTGGRETDPGTTLSPNLVSLVVGETRTLDAFGPDGAILTGLPWSSSDINVVTLSSEDPPLLTAVAEGTATITAGTATATVTVYTGPILPEGTVKWSVPDDGSGLPQLIPAVPSTEGVADVFAIYPSKKVQAITADGHVAWTASLYGTAIADFQGGLIDVGATVRKLDGKTGLPNPSYTLQNYSRDWAIFGVDTDGTIYAMDGNNFVGVDPTTGQLKFSIPLQSGTQTDDNDCPNEVEHDSITTFTYWETDKVDIAGDGHVYLAYNVSSGASNTHCELQEDVLGTVHQSRTNDSHNEDQLRLLRVRSDGEHQDILIHGSTTSSTSTYIKDRVQILVFDADGNPQNVYAYKIHEEGSSGGTYLAQFKDPLTNADQGAVLVWNEVSQPNYSHTRDTDPYGNVTEVLLGGGAPSHSATVTTLAGEQIASENALQVSGDDQRAYIKPVLQFSNGDYIAATSSRKLIRFKASGEVLWTKSATTYVEPLYALADGSTVYREGYAAPQLVTVDANGNEVSRLGDQGVVQSWTGLAYRPGTTEQVEFAPLEFVPTFAASINTTGTAVLRYEAPQSGLYTIAKSDFVANSECSAFLDELASIARVNRRLPGAGSITKETLASQIKTTAASSRDFIYDGPTSSEIMQTCDQDRCVAKFPIWMLGDALPVNYTIRQWFNVDLSRRFALSQYDGSAIWTQLQECGVSDSCVSWNGGWRNWGSPYISSMNGKVNRYGLGLLFHETLHKRAVGGGFTHAEMNKALVINPPADPPSRDYLADQIGKRCFPEAP